MSVERICPNCGTENAIDRATCAKCGANLRLPAVRSNTLPSRRIGPSATGLAVGAGVVIARTGFRLLARQVLPRLVNALTRRAPEMQHKAPPTTEPQKQEMPVEPEPDVHIRGWRTWSVRRGDQETRGSEHFEWRISRRRDGGAGKE